ncbi:MAG: 30S ribosomal protein S16 [Parcubacteria group bacterium GW2011_GWA2_47_26]|nr:MAG: 30S ribosomal protein S16 [Parcubacteria group bacterium GW2011_GWA2_47_26]
MLSIRLSRIGKKHQPFYRIIVLDKRKDPWGDYLENLGTYNPMVKPKAINLNIERIKYWLGVGAKPTPTIWNLLVDQKIVSGVKMKATTGHKGEAAAAAKAGEAPKA